MIRDPVIRNRSSGMREVKPIDRLDDAISVREILLLLRDARWILIIAAAVSLCLSVAYVIVVPSWFRVVVTLKPVEEKSTQGSQSDAAEALTSLTGLNLGGGNAVAEPMAILTSREFLRKFIQDNNLMPVLFARKWDAVHNTWKSSRFSDPPDIRDGEQYFKDRILKVEEVKKTGLVTLTLEWKNPVQAANWANELVDRVNELMRQRALKESQYKVDYLKGELAASNLVTLNQSIGKLLQNELQRLMLAKGDKEYSFRILDHAEPPRSRVGLSKPLTVIEGLFLGVGVCALLLVGHHLIFRRGV